MRNNPIMTLKLPLRWTVKPLIFALASALTTGALAQEAPSGDALTPQQAAAAVRAAGKAASEKPTFPDFTKTVDGLTEIPGLMTLYRSNPDDQSKDHTQLLCRIPERLLNQDLLFATSISRGELSGFQWADSLVRWKVIGKQVVLEAPPVAFVQGKANDPVREAIERTYRPRYLAALPIVTMAGKDPVVDLGRLVFSTVASPPAPQMGMMALYFGSSAQINRSLSTYHKIKNFPENTLVDADLAMSIGGGGFEAVGISYAFRKLPNSTGFVPRVADERVGYFVSQRQDFTAAPSDRDQVRRFIHRWDLQKQDPSLRLSPPKEPIVFVIEDTVPIRWRRWVRAGIEDWNKAFEDIGYVDAIVVQQQTSTNEFADVDPEDARYNFIRWIVSGRGFAMGPSRVDPRTGQILDADIIIDDGLLRFYTREIDVFGPSAMASIAGPGLAEHARKYPEFTALLTGQPVQPQAGQVTAGQLSQPLVKPDHEGLVFGGMSRAAGGLNPNINASHTDSLITRSHDPHHAGCTLATGLQRQVMMGNLVLAHAAAVQTASGKEVTDELLGQVIKDLVSHEVGHTLGLRHNFKASSWLSIDEIKERRAAGNQPTSASVMDYNALLFFAGDKVEDLKTFASPEIGPYDRWAIEYGYTQPENPSQVAAALKAIASRAGEPGLDYATDEDVMYTLTPDPLANRWDHSSDPAAWAASREALSLELLANVEQWAVAQDEPVHYLRRIVDALLVEQAQGFFFLSRQVGGQYFHRGRRADLAARPALVPVDVETQRAALDQLNATIFAEDFAILNPSLLNNLPSARWDTWGGGELRVDYPIHDRILRMQTMALMPLLSPDTVQRIYDAELKAIDGNALTVADLMTSVRDAVWSELKTLDESRTLTVIPTRTATQPATQPDGKPIADSVSTISRDPGILSTRRNLQGQWLAIMKIYAMAPDNASVSPDISRMARLTLRELQSEIDTALEKHQDVIDFATRAHLMESRDVIGRVLAAQYQAQ